MDPCLDSLGNQHRARSSSSTGCHVPRRDRARVGVRSGTELGRIADGLAIGIAIIAAVALASRLYPDPFPTRGIPEFLPGTENRLSFPLGYGTASRSSRRSGCRSFSGATRMAPVPFPRCGDRERADRGCGHLSLFEPGRGRGGDSRRRDAPRPLQPALGAGRSPWDSAGGRCGSALRSPCETRARQRSTRLSRGSGPAQQRCRARAAICGATGVVYALVSRSLRGQCQRSPVCRVGCRCRSRGHRRRRPCRCPSVRAIPGVQGAARERFDRAGGLRQLSPPSGSGSGRWQNWRLRSMPGEARQ